LAADPSFDAQSLIATTSSFSIRLPPSPGDRRKPLSPGLPRDRGNAVSRGAIRTSPGRGRVLSLPPRAVVQREAPMPFRRAPGSRGLVSG
jgi:hypothetical protein